MKMSIQPYKIRKEDRNQVTSPNIFKKNQRKVSDIYLYDDKGLFSRKIFGRIGSCECGELQHQGYCELCGTRVVDPNNLPQFYIDLEARVPKLYIDYGKYKDVKDILEYKKYIITDLSGDYEISDDFERLDPENEDLSDKAILIGVDAAKFLHDDIDDWLDRNTTDIISVPHTIQRPNLKLGNGKIIFSNLNKLYIRILQNLERVKSYKVIYDCETTDQVKKGAMLSLYSVIYEDYIESMKEVFNQFALNKNSLVKSDLKSHRVTSAIKGTVINRFDIDEDIILIGDTFIQTLYPYLYKLYEGDMEQINRHLIENEERVLVNRAPTICHLSIIAMKPRVASCYKFLTFTDGAIGPNSQAEYDEESDVLGLRTLGVNPIICDGMGMDFDGDTILVISIFSDKAKEEADRMLPSKNFMNYANGTIRNGILEDIEYANQ